MPETIKLPDYTDDDIVRLLSHVKIPKDLKKGCWISDLSKTVDGYTRLKIGNKKVYSHRLMLAHVSGKDPTHLEASHTCDVRKCINPYHLRWETAKKNEANKKR